MKEANPYLNSKPFNFNQAVDYASNSIVSQRILEKSTGNVSLFAFDKGQKLSEHTAPYDALLTVVDGTAEIVIAGEQNLLNAGDSIIMPGGIPHAVNAVERFKMTLTMIKLPK